MFENVNVIYWLIALASLVAWARFATFMCEDVAKNLVEQPELPWKLGTGGIFLLLFLVFIIMPNFWIAFIVNFVIVGGAVGGYWALRVKTLGSAGHFFRGTIEAADSMSKNRQERRNARQVQLTYLRHDNSAMPLPSANDPLAAGLGTADAIVIQALMRRAETVDLAPAQDSYSLNLITDGVGTMQPAIDRASAEAAIQALKVLAGLSAEERRRPQVGNFKSRDAEGSQTTWTVRTSGSVAGERVTISSNEKGQWDIPIDRLGMTSEQLAEVKKLAGDTKGLVLVCGPKGHGRTATMYALLKQHDAFTNSVQTLEINSQAEIEGVTVNKFDPRAGADASYSKMLQSIILKDPNVLLVSQVPDSQTADLITRYTGESASEPHRVYTTLPALDSFAALELWLNLNSNKAEAASALRVIIAQRLVRILCPTCKIPYQPDEATMKRLNLPVGRNMQSFKANTEPIIDRKGHAITCPDCNGVGFRGRTGIFEVLVVTDEIKQALAAGTSVNQIKVLARKNNLILLIEHGIRKFAGGVTAIHEVTRVINPDKPSAASGKSGIAPSPTK
ncbi:MAG TPA: ATPase, T2SS/T4P/T4SS family [Phycisphaerae bacterium]|jgi:general secretion pathway protein E